MRIRTLKMEERLKGVQKWFIASQRHPFIPRLLEIVEREDIPLIEGIDISPMMKDRRRGRGRFSSLGLD
jgi:hypothetical protein